MFLKIRFRCDCGCVSEFDEKISTNSITCPNCGKPLPDEVSQKLLNILHNANGIDEKYSEAPLPKLEFVTSWCSDVL